MAVAIGLVILVIVLLLVVARDAQDKIERHDNEHHRR